MNLGLGMMAGKSPYALQNIGEAGLGALKSIQEQKKADVEAQYMQAKIKEANASVDPAELRLARALSPTGDVDEGFRRLTELKREKFDPRAAYNQYILGREKLQATPGVDLPQMMDFPTYARQFYPATTAPGNATIRER
jgi:hypothetical protein